MKEKLRLPHFTLQLEKTGGDFFGLRVVVTRKIKRAVDRNRIKRVVREFFRQKRGLLPWKSVVCRVDPKAAQSKNAELFQELNTLL